MCKVKNIAINAWVLRNKNIDGIGNFTIQTTIQLALLNPGQHYYVLVDWNYKENYFLGYSNIHTKRIFPPWRHPLLYITILDTILPLFLIINKIDTLIGMDGMLSLLTKKKQIAVIHDLNFYHYPKFLPLRNRFFYNTFYPLYAKKANKIATVSNFSKRDIISTYKIDENKINVVYCAAKNIYHPIVEKEKQIIRNKYTNGNPYFLCIGTIHPRKNIENTIKAFKLFLNKKTYNFKLVLVGDFLWNNSSIFNLIDELGVKNDIIILGRIKDEELNNILASANALVFMSFFEGFGIPILEAFATHTPVICSNTTSLNEISGNAALKVDPYNVKEISNKMLELVDSESRREKLITLGTVELNQYSWERTAESINQII